MAAVNTIPASTGAEGRVAAGPRTQDRRGLRIALRIGAGIAVVAATALVVGIGPFLRGLAAISPSAILAALALAAVATAAAAGRWRIVAAGYGLPLTWRAAFGAYYRSQFLNAVLPAGILGDVHRAWAHGRTHARVGAAARAVAVERILGQGVQIALTLAILLPLGLGSSLVPLVWGAGVLAAAVVLAVGIMVAIPRTRRMLRREYDLLRPVLARPGALLAIALTSAVVVSAHVTLFVVACLATGLPLGRGLLMAGLVVLAASAIPINVGGWGPREAAAGRGLRAPRTRGIGGGGRVDRLRGAGPRRRSSGRCRAARRAEGDTMSTSERPYVTLSCAMSIDGYLDSAVPRRLAMSNAADLDRVDDVRARSDAIMVGASTVRRDDPRLLVRDTARRARRLSYGQTESPTKVTVTASGDLSPDAAFFTAGDAPRLVYSPAGRVGRLRARLGERATVVGLGETVTMAALLDDLGDRRGIRRLMVEGGGRVLTQFLAADLVDELQLVIAPFFVGESGRAPRCRGGTVPVDRVASRAPGRHAPDRRRGAAAVRPLRSLRRARRRRRRAATQPSRPNRGDHAIPGSIRVGIAGPSSLARRRFRRVGVLRDRGSDRAPRGAPARPEAARRGIRPGESGGARRHPGRVAPDPAAARDPAVADPAPRARGAVRRARHRGARARGHRPRLPVRARHPVRPAGLAAARKRVRRRGRRGGSLPRHPARRGREWSCSSRARRVSRGPRCASPGSSGGARPGGPCSPEQQRCGWRPLSSHRRGPAIRSPPRHPSSRSGLPRRAPGASSRSRPSSPARSPPIGSPACPPIACSRASAARTSSSPSSRATAGSRSRGTGSRPASPGCSTRVTRRSPPRAT